ncbi:MAG: hypothetical protein ACI8PZ_002301 [Myxococcota bacterium]|jgi:hypothetical protein
MWWSLAVALAGPPTDATPGWPTGADPRPIVGGVPAESGAWPEATALFSSGVFACSGVLIAPDLVLTAGHCNWNLGEARLDTIDHATDPGESIAVAEVFVHDDFFTTFDVSVVRLAEPATVDTPLLALSCMADVLLQDGATATLVGFGATDLAGNDGGSRLHTADVPIGDADCDDPSRGCNTDVMPGGEFRAGGDGVDSCSGDSGGPVYVHDGDGIPWLVGITSRSAVPSETTCGDGGIYVRVDAVQAWIEAVTGTALAEPDCTGVNRAPLAGTQSLQVARGDQVSVWLDPQDPDIDDQHRFEIDAPPDHGTASVDGGLLVYRAPSDVIGDVRLTVRVTDDGDPPLSATVVVDVEIVDIDESAPGGCGCSAGAAHGGWLPTWLGRR